MEKARPSHKPGIYSPLSSGAREIRLLVLHPALRPSWDVKCDLIKTALDPHTSARDRLWARYDYGVRQPINLARPLYEAVSYVWGDQSNTRSIRLNGRDVQVTENLDAALRSLRRPTSRRLLWVDALCINQANLVEKSSQVKLMRDIFETAEQVIVWLGPETPQDEDAFKFARVFHSKTSGGGNLQKKNDWIVKMAVRLNDAWEGAASILQRQWWTRSWIFQEILVARKAVVYSGRRYAPWEAFETMADIINQMEVQILATIPEASGILRFIALYQNLYNITIYRHHRLLSPPTFFELLQLRRRTETSDPRDKVFSILNVCRDEYEHKIPPPPPRSHFLEIDYTRSVEDVYKGVAKHLIKSTKSLDVLSTCQNPTRSNGLPSWAPDWSVARTNNPLENPAQYGHIHFASGIDDFPFELFSSVFRPSSSSAGERGRTLRRGLADDDAISVTGIIVDTIDRLGDVYPVRDRDAMARVEAAWQRLSQRCCHTRTDEEDEEEDEDGGYGSKDEGDESEEEEKEEEDVEESEWVYFTGETVAEAFNTTCLAGRPDPNEQDEGSSRSNSVADSERRRAMSRAWSRWALISAVENRRFFVTKKGLLMGLGPAEAQEGDVVAVLCGSHTATVLRRLERVAPGDAEGFVVVGECYVHGVMKGELFREDTKGSIAKLVGNSMKMRDFVLR